MQTAEQKQTDVAGVVGRWQVDDLHPGHRALIDEVTKNHPKVIVFVGISPILGSKENPLDFPSIKAMIQEHYPATIVLPIVDHGSDAAWSESLDRLIRTVAPIGEVTLYGGRDSFIEHYTGHYHTIELDNLGHPCGTEIRKEVGRTVRTSADFRAGVIYSTQNQYPRVFSTVDIAGLRPLDDGEAVGVVLGRKDGEPGWRFPGGFVDPKDPNLETTARREYLQETDASIDGLEYIGSFVIPDPRVASDTIMTTFFEATISHGPIRAKDDLAEVKIFDLRDLRNIEKQWQPCHKPLFEALLERKGL